MGGLLSAKRITLYAAAAVLIGAGLAPLCVMLASSGVRNYAEALGAARTWALFRNSLLLATLTAICAAVAGVILGILLAKTDLPFRNPLTIVFSAPLLFPPYLLAVGWYEALGRGGLLSQWAGPAAGEVTSRWLFGLPGAVMVLATAHLPVVLLLTMTYLKAVNSNLEEAARLSCGWPTILKRITLPLITPGIVLSLVLVFLLTMGEFGAPAFLRFDVFPVASFTQFSAFYNFGAATAAAMPLVLVALLGLLVEQRVLHGRTFQFRSAGRQEAGRIPLGRMRLRLLLPVAIASGLFVCVPFAALLWRGLSYAALSDAIHRAGESAIRSVAYAGVSATALATLGFFLAYIVHRRAMPAWRLLDALALFLFTLPGTVIGIGLIIAWNRPSTNWVYATPAIVAIGYVAQYAALGARITLAGFSQLSSSVEEAAEIAGAGWFRRVFHILVPLLWPAILAAWTVTFIFCLRDVSLPLLLAPPGRDTLTARTLTLMANGSPELIAALCLLSVALALVPLGVLGVARRLWSRAS
jgi:iron(III) transport system permease protein